MPHSVKANPLPLSLSLAVSMIAASGALAETPAPAPADILLSEDFESTAVCQVPKGFNSVGAVGVAKDSAHGGRHALKMKRAVRGTRMPPLPAPAAASIGGEHWGRL